MTRTMTRTGRVVVAGLFLSIVSLLNAEPAPQPGAVEATLGNAVVALHGPWRFTVGDSPIDPKTDKPLWAEPDFDDSRWETVDLTPEKGAADPGSVLPDRVPGWTARGHAGYSGYAWYRIRVQCQPQPGQSLALAGPPSPDDAYQAFADGELLGSFGDFAGSRTVTYIQRPVMFRLQPRHEPNGTRVIAFRFWMAPSTLINQTDAGGMHSPPVLGEAGAVTLDHEAKWVAVIKSQLVDVISVLAFALLAVMAFSVILFDPSDPVYFWMGLLFLAVSVYPAVNAIEHFTGLLSNKSCLLISYIDAALVQALWAIVWWVWFGRERFRWLPRAVVASTALLMLSILLGEEIFFGVVSHPVALRFHALEELLWFVPLALVVCVVVDAIRRHRLDAWLVLPVVILRVVSVTYDSLSWLHPLTWYPFGMPLALGRISSLLIAMVIALLLLRRLRQSVRRQKQMALDVRQAQELQEVILPERRVVLPGLEIESEYRPAREVGGDFFQIIPHAADDSLLIVAGDVAGKGLKAGMLVALLVGAIRTAAETDADPAAILAVLNRRLLGRGDAPATCLALRIARDGAVTLANAGHLPPYLNGEPLEIEGSLPLGILESLDCSVKDFRLAESDRLLVLSDGVVEATDQNGKLFGFDRAQELIRARVSAARVAEAAQAFGQEDDISVIAVARMAVTEPAPA